MYNCILHNLSYKYVILAICLLFLISLELCVLYCIKNSKINVYTTGYANPWIHAIKLTR